MTTAEQITKATADHEAALAAFAATVAERDTFLSAHPNYFEYDGRSRVSKQATRVFDRMTTAGTNLDRARIRLGLLKGESC